MAVGRSTEGGMSNVPSGFFVTGTDTGCGKTEITLGLMQALQARGLRVLGMKPIASGAEETPDGLRNDDAERIRRQGSVPIAYERVNPYLFRPPIAPHIAAAQAGVAIDFGVIRTELVRLGSEAERVIVEGVGGWRVPLGSDGDVADLTRSLGLPLVLVVGLRLGCINHALLTVESIAAAGVPLAGWVANTLDPEMAASVENLATLRERISAPLLGVVPRLNAPCGGRDVAPFLHVEAL